MGRQSPGELDLIEWIRRQEQELPSSVIHAIGEDCAVFDCSAHPRLAVSSDMLVEDVHFRRGWISPRLLGRKSLLVNLSDLAASGSRPYACLLNLGLPRQLSEDYFRSFMTGFLQESRRWRAPLIGGDLSASAQLTISVTIWGFLQAAPSASRSGARPSDLVAVVGEVGLSRLGLALLEERENGGAAEIQDETALEAWAKDPFQARCLQAHLLPRPQLEAGEWLSRRAIPSAVLDISDGLATDLMRICRESGVAAEIERELLPLPPSGMAGISPLEAALDGGEDYGLLLTLPPGRLGELERDYPAGLAPVRVIGRILEGEPSIHVSSRGRRRRHQPEGYLHLG